MAAEVAEADAVEVVEAAEEAKPEEPVAAEGAKTDDELYSETDPESEEIISDSEDEETHHSTQRVIIYKRPTPKPPEPTQKSTNRVNSNKVSDVSSFGNEDSLEILKGCLNQSLKEINLERGSNPLRAPQTVMREMVKSENLILYPFLNDVRIYTPEKIFITKDDSYNIEIASEKLDEIIYKIYNHFKTKCFNIESELSRYQKILIVCEFILVVFEYIKTKLNSTLQVYL